MQTAHRVPRTLLSPTPDLLTDLRARAAYSEGAGIHRIVPAAVAVPRGVEELQRLVRWAVDRGTHLVPRGGGRDRKSTRLNSSHLVISYAVFCLKKKKKTICTRLLV